jgi:hypothetical protein
VSSIPAFARPFEDRFGLGYHGPQVIPCYAFGDSTREAWPHNPGDYGRYLPIDLTKNNPCWRIVSSDGELLRTGFHNAEEEAIATAAEKYEGVKVERVDFGWGVCRHGFGLQSFGDGYMTQRVAEARAKALNEGRSATDIPNEED